LTKQVSYVKEQQLNVLTQQDLNEMHERIGTKADKIEITQIYDLKSNKSDITSIIKGID